jgi:hypothetical protein
MTIKSPIIDIKNYNPFSNCKLNREEYAEFLTRTVEKHPDGFVLAINNKWGAGKTTFVKMWKQHLENNQFQTIYFNAWENDFDNSPLIALMSGLKTLTKGNIKKAGLFKLVTKKGTILMRNLFPALLKGFAEKYIDTKIVTETIENIAKAGVEILEKEIEEYELKKQTIAEFRKELEEFIKESNNNKPVIFIVDELDRCRPDYAVEALEQIKHFFSVAGIVFVLSIDKKHLSDSVRGFYGSDRIDGDEYLRRFIDWEYSIPEPSADDFVNFLFEHYDFNEFFLKHSNKNQEQENFKKTAKFLFKTAGGTLRQQEKIFSNARIVINSFDENQTNLDIVFVLIYLKIMKNELFQDIENKKLELQQLSDCFYELISASKTNHDRYVLIYLFNTEVQLLQIYKNYKYSNTTTQNLLNKVSIASKIAQDLNINNWSHTILGRCSSIDEYLEKNSHFLNLNSLIKSINFSKN